MCAFASFCVNLNFKFIIFLIHLNLYFIDDDEKRANRVRYTHVSDENFRCVFFFVVFHIILCVWLVRDIQSRQRTQAKHRRQLNLCSHWLLWKQDRDLKMKKKVRKCEWENEWIDIFLDQRIEFFPAFLDLILTHRLWFKWLNL